MLHSPTESKSKMADNKAEINLSIHVDDEVWQKVMYWIDKSPVEISGLGKVVYDERSGIFRVIDAFLVDQENSGAETEMQDSAVAKLMYETHKQPGRLCWWWHSHVNMQAFWSGTDTATIDKLGGGGWVVATVLNKRREYRSAYLQASPNKMFIDNIPTFIGARQVADSLIRAWDGEYDKKVKEKKVSYEKENHESYAAWVAKNLERRSIAEKKFFPKSNTRKYGVDFGDETGDDDAQIRDRIRALLQSDKRESQKVAGFSINNETGAILASDDGPEDSGVEVATEQDVELLPYEEGVEHLSEKELEELFASSYEPDPSEDAEEMDALDLMRRNINKS